MLSQWDAPKEYAAKHFSKQVENGLLPNNGSLPGVVLKCDASKTEQQLGIKAKSFEQMMIDLIGQYVDLAEKEKSN